MPTRSRPIRTIVASTALAIPLALAVTGCASASSPDAWEAYRVAVAEQCAAAADLDDAVVAVDPFGTQSYGLASVTGQSADEGGEVTVVCIVRKTPDGPVEAEIGTPMQNWERAE